VCVFETGPEGPELEDLQAEKKSKAAQTRPKKLIRYTCPSSPLFFLIIPYYRVVQKKNSSSFIDLDNVDNSITVGLAFENPSFCRRVVVCSYCSY
jgi:hypothetical protein